METEEPRYQYNDQLDWRANRIARRKFERSLLPRISKARQNLINLTLSLHAQLSSGGMQFPEDIQPTLLGAIRLHYRIEHGAMELKTSGSWKEEGLEVVSQSACLWTWKNGKMAEEAVRIAEHVRREAGYLYFKHKSAKAFEELDMVKLFTRENTRALPMKPEVAAAKAIAILTHRRRSLDLD